MSNDDELKQLKKAVEEILYNTVTTGNGGYCSNFGPLLFSKLVKLTDYNIFKRGINIHIDKCKIKKSE